MRTLLTIGMTCAILALALAGCCTWRRNDFAYENRRCPEEIAVLSTPPARAYVEVGTVTSPAARASEPLGNYRRLQALTAKLGGDAVILDDWTGEPSEEYWRRQHAGVAIAFTISQLHDF